VVKLGKKDGCSNSVEIEICRVYFAQIPCGPVNDLQKHSTDGTAHPPTAYNI